MLEINPTNLSTETANKLRLLIAHNNNPAFLDRKLTHILPPVMELRLTHNLIIDRESTENVKRYFVISNAPHDDLGIGATNRARRIIGAIEIDTTHASLTYQPISSKVVRITNIKKAQKAHQAQQTKYKHKAAVQAFKKHQPFTHLAMQQPVKRAAHIGRNSAFFFKKKSYTVMNELPGQNLGDEIADFITYIGPDTKTMLDVVLIPILEAYKRQVASTGKVHRDIKPGNINADLYKDTPSIINFLDFDSSLA
ncbi:MAG: protein kinase, partial [uncultured bacterium]